MKKFMAFVEKNIAPMIRKIGDNIWISATQEAILAAVPATLVGSVATLVGVFRSFGLTFLPDLTMLSNFSFGLFGLFLAYQLPCVIMEKKRHRKIARQAGLAGLGLFLLLVYPSYDEAGNLILVSSNLGAGGMLNALVSGYLTAVVFNLFASHSFFKEDSSLPSFVITWFDSIIPWTLCLLFGITLTFTLKFDLIEEIRSLLLPISTFSQSFGGFLLVILLILFMYSFGISAWIIFPLLSLIWMEGQNANVALVAQGLEASNIHTYEVFQMCFIGGQGATLTLCIFMAFLARSKRVKTVGRAALIPSIFNINEPVVYGAPVAFNPTLMIPFWVAGLANALIVWVAFASGFCAVPIEPFRMTMPSILYAPLALKSITGLILHLVCFVVTGLIYYPFFKVYDKQCCLEEEK
ncbi:PTS transporter subunit EIIC [Thomasclavelia sp.]|uniref:PTS sugar transporter subunit IIC n=1 Tax=Thomasclavelia sp. TaxID=3025757 RepID=UPI0025D2C185|nr:PTS transporter subunit EIIC [Thomasclavelia sp.]